jgi:hypothetical protein
MRFKPTKGWNAGSVRVEGNLDSAHPTWVMHASRGNWHIDLASGPLATRHNAERIAAMINRTDPEMWDMIFRQDLRCLLGGEWG